VTVADQAGNGTEFVVAGANATVPYVLDVNYDGVTATSQEFAAGESVENGTIELDPPLENDSAVTVTLRAAANDTALANQTVQYDVVEPSANITAAPQQSGGDNLTVRAANLSDGGFLVVHENTTFQADDVLGNSSSLGPGSHENVTVALDEPLEETTTVNVTVHRDTDVDERFDFTSTAGSVDGPYLNETGEPVTVPVELDVDAGPEPGVAYLNCTTAQVDGSYDRLGVTLGYYNESRNATGEYVWTPSTSRPIDRSTARRSSPSASRTRRR